MLGRALTILCLLGLLVLGCGQKPQESAAPKPEGEGKPAAKADEAQNAQEGPVTLTFWHILNYEGPREVIEQAISRFRRANPNAQVKAQPQDNDSYKAKLDMEMASGTPPDVFQTWGGGKLWQFAKAGLVRNITYEMNENRGAWRKRFMEKPARLCSFQGKFYAAPLDLSCVPVWYNKEIFGKYQVKLPETYEELAGLVRRFRTEGVTPFALGNKQQWPGAFFFIYLAQRLGGTQAFFDVVDRKPGATFNSLPFIRAGEKLQELAKAKAFSTGFGGIDDDEARTQFVNGEAAMYLAGTWAVARIKSENEGFLGKLKCFAFPRIAEGAGEPNVMLGGVNAAFAVSAACKSPQKAVDLLRFLTDETSCEAWCKTGRIPACEVSASALKKLPEPTRAAMELMDKSPTFQPYYDQFFLSSRLKDAHLKTTQELLALQITPGQAADRVENAARGVE